MERVEKYLVFCVGKAFFGFGPQQNNQADATTNNLLLCVLKKVMAFLASV